jgi:hypothetical protein
MNQTFIMDGHFAKLSLKAKAMLFVVEHVRNYETNEFFHRVELLAKLAGIDKNRAFDAIKELEDWQIISHESRPGRSSVRKFHPELAAEPTRNLTPTTHTQKACDTHTQKACEPTRNLLVGTGVKYGDKPAENQASAEEFSQPLILSTDPNTFLNNNRTEKPLENVVVSFKSVETAKLTAADKIPKSLINEMRSKHGSDLVEDILVALESLNGEIKNPAAYFRTCCTKGWIPTSKNARKRADAELMKARAQEMEERLQRESDEEWNEKLKDPETQKLLEKYSKILLG